MPIVDVSAFVGDYPFRGLPHATPDWLLAQMDRTGIDEAWVGHLPTVLFKDPTPGNDALGAATAGHDRLHPVPVVHPGLPHWEQDVGRAADQGAPAVRAYPLHHALSPTGKEMEALVNAAHGAGLALLLTVRFEDGRQRHPADTVPDLPAAAVRHLARLPSAPRLVVTHADRGFVEEVHFGLTTAEADNVLWDFSWIWGPPEDDLARLIETVGVARFTLGTGMPLRIPDGPFAKMDLLDLDSDQRAALTGGTLGGWLGR